MARTVVICLLLIAGTFAAYWPVRQFGYISYDDPLYVTENDRIQGGLNSENIAWAFTTGETGNWHPLTWLSHMLDVELFGIDNAGAHHVVSIALHAFSAALLFIILVQLTAAAWPSAFVAAAFALHPLRVESVAWIAERKDVLSVLFGLLATWAYVRYVRGLMPHAGPSRFKWPAYGAMLFCFAMSLLAKPTLVTLPVLLLILDLWPLRRVHGFDFDENNAAPGARWSTDTIKCVGLLVLEKAPLLLMSLASGIVTMIAQERGGSVESLGRLSIAARLSNAAVSYARYLENTFWPVDLAVLYPHPQHWPVLTVLGAVALLVVITVVCFGLARSRPYLVVGWLWFLVALLPTIGLVQVGAQAMADRYSYWPSVGLLMAVTWGLRDLIAAQPRWIVAMASVAIIITLGAATRLQTRVWSSGEALYRHALQVTKNNWVMEMKLGTELERQGRLADATPHFAEAARLQDKSAIFQLKLSDNLVRQRRFSEGLMSLRRAVALDPNFAEALNNLAWLQATLADPRLRNPQEALIHAERAATLSDYRDPSHLDTLAVVYAANGRFDEAVTTARQAKDIAREQGLLDLAAAIDAHLQMHLARRPLLIESPER